LTAKTRPTVRVASFSSTYSARPEHPLAIVLDDLQWLDAATLDNAVEINVNFYPAHLKGRA
jgi:hypothetical protein